MNDLLYILSPSFSGSTLLTFLLARHPQVATVGELKGSGLGDIDRYVCSCGMRIRECLLWLRIAEELRRGGHPLDLADLGTHFRCRSRKVLDRVLRTRVRNAGFERTRKLALTLIPGGRATLRRILDRNQAFVDAILRVQGGRVFLDASKDPVRLKYLHHSGRWRIRVIYMTRDGRGTACSYMRHYRISMEQAADEWRQTHEECQRVLRRIPPEAQLRIRYEDLCADPDATLANALTLADLPPHRERPDDCRTELHIIGNSMRLTSTREIRLDERWRSELGPGELRTFSRLAGQLNAQFGYG